MTKIVAKLLTVPSIARARKAIREILKLLAVLLKFAFYAGLGIGAMWLVVTLIQGTYQTVDDAGWVPHTRVVTVYVKANFWIVGEYKTCYSEPTKDKADLGELDCDLELSRWHLGYSSTVPDGHKLNVKFWGTVATDKNKVWNCQRGESLIARETSVTCKLQ